MEGFRMLCAYVVNGETDIQHFNNQLTHTTLKNVELLKHFKISKTAPTCFGLQGNWNMLEQFYLFYNVLITLRFLTLCASVGY